MNSDLVMSSFPKVYSFYSIFLFCATAVSSSRMLDRSDKSRCALLSEKTFSTPSLVMFAKGFCIVVLSS